ncbi:MAG: flagellar filament capping protein FliD, partial [Pseudobdellovibrionaceae bacterium]
MAGIRISGMASGLPPNIVEQLMDAERIPVKNMENQKAKNEDKLKLVTELETKVNDITKNLGELTSTKGFSDKKLTSGDPNIVDGTLDPGLAVPGDYSLEVLQLAQKPSAISNGFPDKDKTQLGVGYIKFKTSEGLKEVYINGKNSTLTGVADQINAQDLGLRASV